MTLAKDMVIMLQYMNVSNEHAAAVSLHNVVITIISWKIW